MLIPFIISFLTTFILIPYFIKILRLEGIVGKDQMKKGNPKIPEMGGPPVLFGFIFGIFSYIFAQTFIIKFFSPTIMLQVMAAITSLIIMFFLGTLDELTCLMKIKNGLKRIGLKKIVQVFLPIPAALPLMAINAGVSQITIPFLGSVDVGIIYPLVLIPIGILGAANATNMLAGFNGLQAGLGSSIFFFLGIYSYINGSFGASLISFTLMASLLAFLYYNWYPAKIFPGGLDYVVGVGIATVAIIGNIEKFAILCFAPWFIEFFLKARSKFKAENFGILQKDGRLKSPYKKIYSLTHLVMKLGKFREWEVSLILIISFTLWFALVFLVMI